MYFTESMLCVPQEITERQCVHCNRADPAFSAGIRAALAKLAGASAAAE